AWFPETVLLTITHEPPLPVWPTAIPPPEAAEKPLAVLPLTVVLRRMRIEPALPVLIAPPLKGLEEFPERVQEVSVTVALPTLIAPPAPAEHESIVVRTSATVPPAETPPP